MAYINTYDTGQRIVDSINKEFLLKTEDLVAALCSLKLLYVNELRKKTMLTFDIEGLLCIKKYLRDIFIP